MGQFRPGGGAVTFLDDTPRAALPRGRRLSPAALVVASLPLAIALVVLPADAMWFHYLGMVLSAVSFLALLVYRQHAAHLSGFSDYERVTWISRTLAALIVASVVVLALHAYPWALEIATRACA